MFGDLVLAVVDALIPGGIGRTSRLARDLHPAGGQSRRQGLGGKPRGTAYRVTIDTGFTCLCDGSTQHYGLRTIRIVDRLRILE